MASGYYIERKAITACMQCVFPESHSDFLPDDLFDGSRDALFYPQGQKLDFAPDGPEIMKGWGGL